MALETPMAGAFHRPNSDWFDSQVVEVLEFARLLGGSGGVPWAKNIIPLWCRIHFDTKMLGDYHHIPMYHLFSMEKTMRIHCK